MYRTQDLVNGLPPRIYRMPSEIKRDIKEITRKIEETGEMLNIRSLLVDMLVGDLGDNPEKLIPELEEAIFEARRALSKLKDLKEELSLLEEELGEVKCQLKM